MDLRSYFKDTDGLGVLSTADAKGKVDAAVYSRPHVMDDDTVAFIMADRLTHANLQDNPHAAFLFKEEGQGYNGVRLFLTKTGEERDTELLYSLRRKKYGCEDLETDKNRFLVFFKVDRTHPLVGAGDPIESGLRGMS